MLHGQENLKGIVACKFRKKTYVVNFVKNLCVYGFKKNQQVACRGHQAQQPVSCRMARKK
jgi:hypothetical protein